jgi:hypothetical protein
MKRYEVTRQPRDGDFPWQHQYTDTYRVCAPLGSTPVWGGLGHAKRLQTTSPLLSLYDSTCAGG